VVLAKEVDDDRREVEDGGGGIGFGAEVCVLLGSALEDIGGFPIFLYTIKRKLVVNCKCSPFVLIESYTIHSINEIYNPQQGLL
jgi:hypothetical protein